jgi:DNA-binding beta-propeller fold protein YncE
MTHIARRLTVMFLLTLAASSSAQTTYRVAKQMKVGGEGFWDYLVADTTSHRLFVSRGTHVMVFNTDNDSLVGDIPNTLGVHGVALAPQLGRGFTSNGRDSSLTVFDYRTLATIAVVKIAAANPDAIIFEPTTKRVFTFNGRSQDATAIDAASGNVLGNIALGGKPEAATFDLQGKVFVNIEDDSGKVAVIDAKSLQRTAVWNVPGCASPSGQAIDRVHSLLFLACENSVMAVVSYATGAEVATVPIGEGTDGAAFDAASGLAFSTNGRDGTLTVIHEDAPNRFTVRGNVTTQRGARTIALDERTHAVYTVTAEFGQAPAATADQPRPRPPMVPGSFTVIELRP